MSPLKTQKGKQSTKLKESTLASTCDKHVFPHAAITLLNKSLLAWYDQEQRILPWRELATTETDSNVRGYAVWVSEVMLQQTQVVTVIPYFNKWIQKWPTVQSLAVAELEEVYKVWAGLGYYSRARRLHEGAKVVMSKLNGELPQTVPELMKWIPGIGMYSASAIASIAYRKPVGVVDGNVVRVLSRMREIGGIVNQTAVRDHFWSLANEIVSQTRPGDFNQALMELGARICTPQNPKCSECPVKHLCSGYMNTMKNTNSKGTLDSFFKRKLPELKNDKSADVINVEDCHLCLPASLWNGNLQVTVYPCKMKKKEPRTEKIVVAVIESHKKFLMTKRPNEGLLGGLWEFPNTLWSENAMDSLLESVNISNSSIASRKFVSEVVHIFSHIRTTYIVEHLILKTSKLKKELSWKSSDDVNTAAVSTAMKKILKAVQNINEKTKVPQKRKKADSKQSSIKVFCK